MIFLSWLGLDGVAVIMDGFQDEANAFVSRLINAMQADYKQLSRPAKALAVEALHDRFADKLSLDCSLAKKRKRQSAKRQLKPEVREALQQCVRILSLCEEVPERGEEFAGSVADGVREVAETIEEQNRVTADQQRALDNWEAGIAAWLR
ncbi:MAG: hypothetical protein GXY83_23140 [Rhodopirellula sp.]|nr:hypothetical protein [Rhodopirellula sp.]